MSHIERYIGVRIKTRRIQLGLTQGELARRMNISYQQIQKYEAGANRIALSRVLELARSLETTLGFFVEGLEPHPELVQTSRDGNARPIDAIGAASVKNPGVQKAIDRLIQAVQSRERPSDDHNA